jgi:hypothetical protein
MSQQPTHPECHFCGGHSFPIHADSTDQYGEPVCVRCFNLSFSIDGTNES